MIQNTVCAKPSYTDRPKRGCKSIYTSQSEKLTQKKVISAYAFICVRCRSDRDCREHIYIELGTRPI